jgi:hypothetical protein
MGNLKDKMVSGRKRILAVGATGAGKSAQAWTLPGRKFGYVFDPNTLSTWKGLADQLGIEPPDIDAEEFYPDILNLDSTLKGFRTGSKSDKPEDIGRTKKQAEPTVYLDFVEDINRRVDEGFFEPYDWLLFDGLTFLSKAVMARNMYINDHYGHIEDLADYRVVGSKISDVFTSLSTLDINIYMTAHWSSFQDEKTKKIEVQINAPGSSRRMLPLVFTDIWLCGRDEKDYVVRTVPDPRGLQDLRCSIVGLKDIEDVTIDDFSKAEEFGIGAILTEHGWMPKTTSAVKGTASSKKRK